MAARKCTPVAAAPASELVQARRERAEAQRLLDEVREALRLLGARRPTIADVDTAVRQLARGVLGLDGPAAEETAGTLLQLVASGEVEILSADGGEFVYFGTGLDRKQVTACA